MALSKVSVPENVSSYSSFGDYFPCRTYKTISPTVKSLESDHRWTGTVDGGHDGVLPNF
jgi:hypothetical protein